MIRKFFKHNKDPLNGTERMEFFSDAVIAIVMTLLVLEIHAPILKSTSAAGVLTALWALAPQFIAFAFSFLILAIIWVNHHHFLHPVTGVDQKLLWYNNHLLFWVCVIPFATKFVGEYPEVPMVVALYGFVMTMMALAFTVMLRYVFFNCKLLPEKIVTKAVRHVQYKRALFGPVMYGLATLFAFFLPVVSYIIFALVVVFYFIPQRLTEGEHGDNETEVQYGV